MKKYTYIAIMVLVAFNLTACTKTDVEIDLEEARNSEESLTEEEMNALSGEDPEFQTDYLKAVEDAVTEQYLDDSIALIDEIEGSKADKREGKGSVGSCNSIEEASTCLEYYGSIWTEESARFNCNTSGTFSTEPCPRDFAGGCNTGVSTAADMVAWMYLYGGGGLTAESLKNAKMACDSTLASNWID